MSRGRDTPWWTGSWPAPSRGLWRPRRWASSCTCRWRWRRAFPATGPPKSIGWSGRRCSAATLVVATSQWSADYLERHHLVTGVVVAPPGVEPSPVGAGSDPPLLVHVAALLPNKDQLGVVAALSGLTDLDWRARLVGSDARDPAYAAAVRDAVRSSRYSRTGWRSRARWLARRPGPVPTWPCCRPGWRPSGWSSPRLSPAASPPSSARAGRRKPSASTETGKSPRGRGAGGGPGRPDAGAAALVDRRDPPGRAPGQCVDATGHTGGMGDDRAARPHGTGRACGPVLMLAARVVLPVLALALLWQQLGSAGLPSRARGDRSDPAAGRRAARRGGGDGTGGQVADPHGRQRDPIGRREALAECYRASALNTVLPGGVAGDVLRAWRQRARAPEGWRPAAGSVLADRMTGLCLFLAAAAVVLGNPVSARARSSLRGRFARCLVRRSTSTATARSPGRAPGSGDGRQSRWRAWSA